MTGLKTGSGVLRCLTRTAAAILAVSFILSGCGGATPGAAVTLTGTLAFPSTQSLSIAHGFISALRDAVDFQLQVDPSNLHIVCFDTAKSPILQIDGTISPAGLFTLDLTPAAGDPVNCSVLDADNKVVAAMVFSGSVASMDGSAGTFETFALQAGVDLGSINVNLAAGEAVANGTLLGQAPVITVDQAVDFTGTWTIGNLPAVQIPKGYKGVCTQAQAEAERHANTFPRVCDGPSEGQTIYMKRLAGKGFTPDAACAAKVAGKTFANSDVCGGVTGADDVFGIMIWKSLANFDQCGDKLGYTHDQAKAFAGVDLTNSGVASGAPTWSPTFTDKNGVVHTVTDGWKVADAKATWNVTDGGSYTEGGISYWRQFDAGRVHYQLGLQSSNGCTNDADSNPYQPDWNSVVQGSWTCGGASTITSGQRSLNHNVCHNHDAKVTFTCTNTGQTFTNTTGTSSDAPFFGTFTPNQLVAQNALCSGLGANPLAQIQCYANAFYGNGSNPGPGQGDGGADGCFRDLRTNWGTDDVTKFIVEDGPGRAKSQFVLEKMNYTSPTTFAFRQIQHDFQGIPGNNGAWTACDVEKVTTISAAMQPDGKSAQVKFVTNAVLNDLKPACVADKAALTSTSFSIFTFTKN